MPKLQKRSTASASASFEQGRYESFPPDTRQPIPMMPGEAQPTASGGLMSNNPWVQHSPFSAFSPVSPVTPMQATMVQPEPQRPTSSRSSTDIRRLNGTPYNAGQKPPKVAKDMHEGAVPPAYNGTPDSHGPADCSKPNCNKCGKRRTTSGEQPSPPAVRAATHYSRPISTTSTVAGPSSRPLTKCNKCGKHKKPILAPMPPPAAFGAQHRFSSQSTIVPSPARPQQPQLSILAGDNLPRPSIPQLDVIPPSASTYRPRDSTISTFHEDAPLVKGTRPEYKPFRPASLIRSLSRRSSNSRSNPPTPGTEKGELTPSSSGGFMGLIRNQSKRDYHKLGADEPNSRPASPFSFMEAPNDDAFEMRPMTGKEKEFNDRSSDGSRSSSSIKSPTRHGGETLTVIRPEQSHSQNGSDLMLAIPEQGGENRPQLTRFKSLRSGVSRAASTVSRSGSLKRLGSISKAWERNDMSLDAYNGEGSTVSAY